MPARRDPESTRAATPMLWGGAVLFLGLVTAGLVGAAVVLWRAIDVEALVRAESDEPPPVTLPVPEPLFQPLPEVASWSAFLYESAASARFFPDTSYYPRLLGRWTQILEEAGADVTRLSNPSAMTELPPGATVIAPAAVCLSEGERSAFRRHLASGGNVLASWAVGARDGSCGWLGFGFVSELAGTGVAESIEADAAFYVTVPSGGPLAVGLAPGLRVELRMEPWIGLRAPEAGPYWSDYALNPLPPRYGGVYRAALTRRRGESGRFVWFGYRLDVGAREADQLVLDRMAANAALWASGHVLAELHPWPGGHRAALVVTQDVEHSYANGRFLARRMRELGLPVTFFAVSRLVLDDPALAAELAAAGEVGSHSVDHRQVAGWSSASQLPALSQAHADIESWTGSPPLGIRPPRELFDSTTIAIWRRLGGRYIAATNGARSAAPEVYGTPAGDLVVLPRVVDDDYAVMVLRGERSADSLAAALSAGLDRARALGGLDLMTLHTQLVDGPSRVAAVAEAVREARRVGDVWIASASEVADWWLARSQLRLAVEGRRDGSASIRLANAGPTPIEAVTLRLQLPHAPERYAAPEIGATNPPGALGPYGLDVALPVLEPGDSVTVLLPTR